MELQRRYFKGKEVWVEVDHLGDAIIEDGRVSMRYQNDKEAKVYRASPSNLSAQAADLVDATESFEKKRAPSKAKKGTKSNSEDIILHESTESWGPRRESTTTPDEIAELKTPPTGVIEIYTDGACSGNPGPSGYGVVLRDGERYLEISQYLGIGTNNIAELMAIKIALESIPKEERDRKVHIYSDSTYCIGVLTKGWKAKANRELILALRELVKAFTDLHFFKVKGHAGHPLNERADLMATSSLEHR